MTTITSLKALLRDRMMNNGTVMVRISEESVAQQNDIMAYMVKATGFKVEEVTEEDLEMAEFFARKFTTASLGTNIVDGVLMVETQEMYDTAVAVIDASFGQAPRGMLLPVHLINELVNEEKQYAL